jgi:K+-sensing histidine kinase KdpD
MHEPTNRPDSQHWEGLAPTQVLDALVYELYNPVSTLGSQLKRLTDDDDPISEEEYEEIFTQMHNAVRQLSKTVVNLKRYNEGRKDHP